MTKNKTHGLWADSASTCPDLPTLQRSEKTEVAIIGGGYTGLSAALHLAKMGKDCAVIEAENVGYGGAGRNVGLVNAGLWLAPEEVIKLAGPTYGERLLTDLGASPRLVFDLIKEYNISCESLQNGTLHCAATKSGYKKLKQREMQWRKRGAPVRLLEPDEAAKCTGSNAFYGALLDERAGTIQPLAYVYGLAQAALKEGAQIYCESPVIEFKKENDGWILRTREGSIQAKSVIIAVHGYAEHAFKENQKNLVPFNYFQFATKPLPPNILKTVLPNRQGAWDTNWILSSYRLDSTDRLIVGSVGTVDGFAWGLHENWVKRTIKKVFPQIGDTQMEYGWHGRIAMTTNHIPRFHLLDKNFVMISSFNGRGIGPGTLFGKLLAEYIVNQSLENIPLPPTKMDPVSFRCLRGLFYEAGARIYHYLQRRI